MTALFCDGSKGRSMTDKAIDAAARAVADVTSQRLPPAGDVITCERIAQAAISAYLTQREADGFVMAQRGYEAIQIFNDLCRMIAEDARRGQPVDDDLMTATKVLEDRYEQVRAMIAARPQVKG